MAKKPNVTSGSRISNIIGLMRGNFDFQDTPRNNSTVAYGSPELISQEARVKILSGAFRAVEPTRQERVTQASILGIVQSSLSKVGAERLENRKILQLMPEVDKAARLMIASTFSPNDLTRQEIPVNFDIEGVSENHLDRLSEYATGFFQKKLNLKTSAASWVYQFGYEAGAAIFAIVPLRSFERIEDSSYLGLESFLTQVVDPIAHESLFGFGDNVSSDVKSRNEFTGLESVAHDFLSSLQPTTAESKATQEVPESVRELVKKMIAQEALSLTDNPSILQVNDVAKKKAKERTDSILKKNYRRPAPEPVVSLSSSREAQAATEDSEEKQGVVGNPILMRLPPESVTVIHTPGDPSDHQGYLVLLDRQGNPINAVATEEDLASNHRDFNGGQGNIFNQVYNAYGLSASGRGMSNEDTMSRIYTQIVSEHLRKRIGKAGFTNVEIGNTDSVFRCMFARFLQQKQTRVLFMPKDLVSYMTFEMDQNGYGVSRLDRIKFNLGMKMAVQVSRVLASIKAAMDRRKIEIKFTDNLMENPESVFQNVIREYLNKSTMSFSIDPNVIQNQIADKSVSIQGVDIPGMEQFSLTNEPDNRTASVDFDPSILEYLDKQILNGLHVPASTMNSLNEDEYARSVTTTNLFFSMDVSIDQDIVIRCISDLLRKYARYSEDFQVGIYEIAPSLKEGSKNDKSSIESNAETKDKEEDTFSLPEDYTLDKLIDAMSISLPHPNVAPSKAQFESLDAMVTSITATVNALFPDELAGTDDTLAPVVRMLRAKFAAMNIRTYLEGSGMSGIDIPDSNFTSIMKETNGLVQALQNIREMLSDKAKLVAPKEDMGTTLDGYQ